MNMDRWLNKVITGDCLDVMREMPDVCIDLTVTSPPYDDLRTYKGFSWDFEGIARELFRITKAGGVVVWVVADKTIGGGETGISFKQVLYFMDLGFLLHDTMIYAKRSCCYPDKQRYNNSFEYMFVLSKGIPKTINLISDKENTRFGDKVTGSERRKDGELNRDRSCLGQPIKQFGVRNNVWVIDNGYMKTTKDQCYQHPAMFPEVLARDHILSWSNPGDIALDPFMGSGTTGKMAAMFGRNYIGMEISPEYATLARKRITQETAQQRMFV